MNYRPSVDPAGCNWRVRRRPPRGAGPPGHACPWCAGQKPRQLACRYPGAEGRAARRCECLWWQATAGRPDREGRPALPCRSHRWRGEHHGTKAGAANGPDANGAFLEQRRLDPARGGQPVQKAETFGCERSPPCEWRRSPRATADTRRQQGHAPPSTP